MKTHKRIRNTIIAGAALAGTAVIVPTVAGAGNDNRPVQTYTVTVENLTPAGSQPFSPVGTVVHNRRVDVWSVGSPASAAVAAVAEDANLPIFAGTYSKVAGVSSSTVGGAGPFGPGETISFEVEARHGDRLSLVSMLVNTNDAFTGLDSIRLGRHSQEFEVGAYDAGTEVNNELPAYIPGPAGGSPFVRDPEAGVVGPHHGIIGVEGGIDPAAYDWNDSVARITIERQG